MNKNKLKTFARAARRKLMQQVRSKLHYVLNTDSAELRNKEKQIRKLKEEIRKTSEKEVVEKVAYTWFNRISALRFMDANGYTSVKVVSPTEGHTTPEILAEAKKGFIDENLRVDRDKIHDLLDGRIPARDAQNEVYQLLLVAVCNDYHKIMPFMFEPIDDYTELLMPDDLLSEQSIINEILQNIPDEDCQNVEIIGWLYQFYISEKKDEVINRRSVVAKEEIPAATQLFTPHWMVRFLVENSLGRLWMLNRPHSRLAERMDYYIKPEQEETDFLRITSPEKIKICDPACGSGHMLVYAFDMLYAIYEEEGYDAPEIQRLILEKNIYGIEIDERAGELAAFALFMKARSKDRRFFHEPIQPNICLLENVSFEKEEIDTYMKEVGRDLFTASLQITLSQFEEADNFGSLIRPALTDSTQIRQTLEQKDIGGSIFLHDVQQRVLKVLKQADYLSPKYHVVVANPPYMGGKGMNGRLKQFMQDNYGDVKSDLFSAFFVRCLGMTLSKGQLGLITPFVWMFISSYEKLRNLVLSENTITNLVQLEYNAFEPACIPVCAYTLSKSHYEDYKGAFIRLSDFRGAENQAPKTLEAIRNRECGWFYKASTADLRKIPGSPIAYWVSDRIREIFDSFDNVGTYFRVCKGMFTGDNNRFMRYFWEVSFSNIVDECFSHEDSKSDPRKWYKYQKGGEYRRWYGNIVHIVNYQKDGFELRSFPGFGDRNPQYYFRPAVCWSDLTSGSLSGRLMPHSHIFNSTGPCIFSKDAETLINILALLNTKVCNLFSNLLNPTFHFAPGNARQIPLPSQFSELRCDAARKCKEIAKADWDCQETSYEFEAPQLINDKNCRDSLSESFKTLRRNLQTVMLEMQSLEEENNRIFINAFGLQDELAADMSLEEITLNRNPYYQYGNGKIEEEYEALLLADTMEEFINYSVGCMFGRYSLDKPGLILANQGESVEDYIREIGKHETQITFMPDEDNIIPVLEDQYFTDDIAGRFLTFLKITFGEEHFSENLKFIEDAIGKSIRTYFVKHFYADHVKRYKKRPIYWMFSSPKKGFNALIYMHRYRKDTLSRLLNEYLREYITKLEARQTQLKNISLSESASVRDRKQADKEIAKIDRMLKDVREYEHMLYQLAAQKIEIDLDDGVKVNYCKFKEVLAPIAGLCK